MEERIKKALEIAWRYGQIDGSNHKMWVIDQIVKILCKDEKEYSDWVERYETSMGIDEYYKWKEHYKWDTGIAP